MPGGRQVASSSSVRFRGRAPRPVVLMSIALLISSTACSRALKSGDGGATQTGRAPLGSFVVADVGTFKVRHTTTLDRLSLPLPRGLRVAASAVSPLEFGAACFRSFNGVHFAAGAQRLVHARVLAGRQYYVQVAVQATRLGDLTIGHATVIDGSQRLKVGNIVTHMSVISDDEFQTKRGCNLN